MLSFNYNIYILLTIFSRFLICTDNDIVNFVSVEGFFKKFILKFANYYLKYLKFVRELERKREVSD